MANEEGKAHIWKQHLVCCVVISWLVASGASGVRPLERGATNGDSPVQRLPAPCTARALRVAFPGMGALIRWYISSKAKYLLESDSEQVPWGKDAKYFEKRVICAWNHCITSTWILLFRWISATILGAWNLALIADATKASAKHPVWRTLWALRLVYVWCEFWFSGSPHILA